MTEQTTQTTETNETFSTPQDEQQTSEKTTEEQFYGKDEDTIQEPSQGQETSTESEKPEGEKVAEGEVEGDEGEKKTDSADDKESEDWSLEIPKDGFVSEESLKEIEAFAKENKLGKEAAAKLLERENLAIANFINKQEQDMNAELDQWRESVINDPQLGGENLKVTVENARRVVERFGNEPFINLLRDTGYGDNPEVVRFLSKIGKLMSDDTLVTPQSKRENKPIEEYFYPSNG